MSEQPLMRRASDQFDPIAHALEVAVEAKTIIERHEKICDQDRADRRVQIAELQKSIGALQLSLATAKSEVSRQIITGMAWFIGLLVISMGYFLATFGLPGHH